VNNLEYLEYNNLKLSYLVKGSGSKGLICFHGFGRNATDFMALNLSSDLKIISINLPFHSESKFLEKDLEKTFRKEDLRYCVSKLIENEKIESTFIVGYSLGAKAALCLIESNTIKVNGAVLFAPDGFKSNPWYWFASQTKIGESLNKMSIRKPWIFNAFLKLSKTVGFASERQLKFAEEQMYTIEKRELVYNIWRAHRKLKANLNEISSRIKLEHIPLKIVLGKFDKIIPASQIKKWSSSSPPSVLIEEKCGHVIPVEIMERQISLLI